MKHSIVMLQMRTVANGVVVICQVQSPNETSEYVFPSAKDAAEFMKKKIEELCG